MINPLIKAQLKNCRIAQIPDYDENTVIEITIPKGQDIIVTPYQVGKCYLIELADYIIHPSPEFTLAANWNQGRIPTYKHYKASITDVQGKMVKFLGSGYNMLTEQDAVTVWEGWVPQKGIKILEEYK